MDGQCFFYHVIKISIGISILKFASGYIYMSPLFFLQNCHRQKKNVNVVASYEDQPKSKIEAIVRNGDPNQPRRKDVTKNSKIKPVKTRGKGKYEIKEDSLKRIEAGICSMMSVLLPGHGAS